MAKTIYHKTALTGGGTGALDAVDGVVLLDGDAAFVLVGNVSYQYILDDNSAAAESSPDILAPDTHPGDKRWILQKVYITSGVSGTLPVANGGTGITTITDHGIMLGSGTNAVTPMAVGATGEVVVGQTGADPVWSSAPVIGTSITVPIVYGSSADNGDITIEGTSSATKTTSNVVLQSTGGNVGIGTTDPVFDANGASGGTYLTLKSGSTLSEIGVALNQANVTGYLGAYAFANYALGATEKRNAAIFGANDGETNSGNIQFWTSNAGTLAEVMRIAKNGNAGFNTSTFGTSAAKVLALGEGTAPTTSPANAAQVWSADRSGVAGSNTLHMRDELGNIGPVGFEGVTRGQAASTTATTPALTGNVTTSGTSTTVVFSVAADAVLAGYRAVGPILGTTVIANSLTRYITAWTNSTTCTVDSAVDWDPGVAITSVQLPITTFVDSAGVTKGWLNAAGNMYFAENVGIGNSTPGSTISIKKPSGSVQFELASGSTLSYVGPGGSTWDIWTQANLPFVLTLNSIEQLRVLTNGNILTGGLTAAGTSAAKMLYMGVGTDASDSPASAAGIVVKDVGGVADKAAFHMRNEDGKNGPIAFASIQEYLIHDSGAITAEKLYGGQINTYGQDADATLTLPAAVLGMNFILFIGTTVAKYLRLDPDGGDSIYLDGVTTGDGKYIGVASAAIGNMVQFSTATTAGGVAWIASTVSGAWVAEA